MVGLTEAPAWPTLRSHLALIALEEHSPLKVLSAAVQVGSLADARDPAAVLDARIDDLLANRADEFAAALPHDPHRPAATESPLPWLPGIPGRLSRSVIAALWRCIRRLRASRKLCHGVSSIGPR